MPLDWTAQGGTLQLRFVLIDCSTRVFRRKAEAALGPRFDVRRFHDAVLGSGSVPMPVLDQIIADFIAAEAQRREDRRRRSRQARRP
jgi:Bacterial protein of unknown function (DUF885)